MITLKIGQEASDEDIVETFAHELDHHIRAWKDMRLGERRAERFAQKILERWRAQRAKTPRLGIR